MKNILAGVLAIFLLFQTVSADDKGAVDTLIRGSVNKALDILKDKKLDKETKRKQVRTVVDSSFDIPLMAKLVLGRKHWPKFSETQRKEFTDLFVKAVQDSYFDKVDLLSNEYVEFDKPVSAGDKFQMASYLIAKEKRYKMLFKLYRKQDSWLIYDVEIEGISFVRSYGGQYDQYLQNNPVKDLLAQLREKTMGVPEELKSKEKQKKPAESGETKSP